MANDLTAVPAPPVGAAAGRPDDLGLDRAFLMSMARVPLIAALWVAAAWVASAAVEAFGWGLSVTLADGTVTSLNLGPVAVICFGMLLAAVIDGYAFKVPNWCTLSLVVSGWYIGLLHDFGVQAVPGFLGGGGFAAAFAGTMLGFALLFPVLFIGGMGQGDVKMTMGFGSWVTAYFGFAVGAKVLLLSFALGVIVGGVFALVMMVLRRQFYTNLVNFREIVRDVQVMMTAGHGKAAERANSRRKDWWRLPYGVPLCVGFVGYLAFDLYRASGQ
jgi:prepilin peptidase CpaA